MSWQKLWALLRRDTAATRPPIPIAHWQEGVHFTGITEEGAKITYCPKGRIVSWSAGDHDHKWCHFCQEFFSDKVLALLTPAEQDRRRQSLK